jgi:hypothetical protein
VIDHRRAEILFGGVVSRRDVWWIAEDEQAGAMSAMAVLESAGVGGVSVRSEGAEHEVDGGLDQQPALAE